MQYHGSPADRGSADAYYSRQPNPHYYPNGTYNDPKITKENMTEKEISEYMTAYESETDRKQW
jgi:hypothetical protein